VSDSLLDPAELEAIQAAIRETAPRRGAPQDLEPTRLALIADDRIAEAARPVLIGLANRWTRVAARALRNHLPGTWQLDVAGAEVVDGSTVKDELRGGWVAGATSATAEDHAEIVLAAHGGVVDIAAARRCGASAPTADANRAPSAVSLRLFEPAGKSLLDSLGATWREVFERALVPSADVAIVARMIGARTIVRVALAFSGSVTGRVQIYARPESLVPRPVALAAIKANTALIVNALGNVPVEVVAELGTLRLPMHELRSLAVGASFTLPGFVDSPVPVFCEGVLKAWARPVVCRGVLAVQIVNVVHGQGTKS
jgi:flagellar motor switch/type III secretory pathway protein FliN